MFAFTAAELDARSGANNGHIAQGSAAKNKKWAVKVAPAEDRRGGGKARRASSGCRRKRRRKKLSPAADRKPPWQESALQGGCRLRTFWQENAAA